MIVYRQTAGSDVWRKSVSLRRVVTTCVIATGATAVLMGSAAPARADGCGTVHVPGHETVEVCNPVIATVEDLLKVS
jgi:hypothetical protein